MGEGLALFDSAKFEGAKTSFERVSRSDTNSASAAFWVGRSLMELEREPEAVPWFEKATVLEPKSAENHYWLGNAHGAIAQKAGVSFKGMGAIRKGRSAWEKAIELDPKHLGARQTLILFFLAAPGIAGGSVDKARDQAKAVAGFNPVEGHLAQARIARYEKKPADAEKELDAALALSPSNTSVLAQRGLLRAEMKKFDLALADLRRWRELAPKNRLAIYQIGRLAALSGQGLGEGEVALKEYLASEPLEGEPGKGSARWRLALIYEHKGDKAAARSEIEAAAKLEPKNEQIQKTLKRLR